MQMRTFYFGLKESKLMVELAKAATSALWPLMKKRYRQGERYTDKEWNVLKDPWELVFTAIQGEFIANNIGIAPKPRTEREDYPAAEITLTAPQLREAIHQALRTTIPDKDTIAIVNAIHDTIWNHAQANDGKKETE